MPCLQTTQGQKSPMDASSESSAKNLKRKTVAQKATTGKATSAATNKATSGKPASGGMSLEDKMMIYSEMQKKIASQQKNAREDNDAGMCSNYFQKFYDNYRYM